MISELRTLVDDLYLQLLEKEGQLSEKQQENELLKHQLDAFAKTDN